MSYTHFIPKIEWLKGSLSGTTSIGSPTVTGIADTSDIITGEPYNMYFEGTGIPAGAVVLSKTASTVTLDKNATVAATNTFNFGFRLEFEYPPEKDPIASNPRWQGSVTTSKSGLTQYMEDFIEYETKLSFSHIKQAIKDKYEYFLVSHALGGESFSFFRDKNEPASEEVVEKNDSFVNPNFKVITRKGAGFSFLWEFKLEFRKVYGT